MWELKYTKNLGVIFSLKVTKTETNIASDLVETKYEKTYVISYHSLPKSFKFIIQLKQKKKGKKNDTERNIMLFKLFHMFIL